MPAPSQTTAQDINTELGVSSTAQIQMSNNWVKNVACKSSGAISYGDCRWGINFPGGSVTGTGYSKNYDTDEKLYAIGASANFGGAYAEVSISIKNNGDMDIYVTDMTGTYTKTVTWKTSGNVGDYTAQLQVVTGLAPGGSAANTDLNLGTTRTWNWVASVGVGSAAGGADGNLIIKDGGGTLITRPFYASVFAEGF